MLSIIKLSFSRNLCPIKEPQEQIEETEDATWNLSLQ